MSQFIGGRHVPSASGETFPDLNPATGGEVGRVPRGNAEDVERAVAAAEAAGPEWAARAPADRARLLDAVAERIEGRLESLARLESLDTGKPVSLAQAIDIPRAAANFRFFAGAVRHDETGCHTTPGVLNYTLRRPLGVVGLITPWNLPLYLLTWKTAPALAMGNTVVAKPSELTPLTAQALAEILDEVGVPPGVFNVVHGYGAEVGQALVEHPRLKAISFTGGTLTGARVAATAAPQFKKLSLELGGKNPTLVFADCDLERALAGTARAGFTNQGQVCLCGSRVFVEQSIYREFVDGLVARVGAMKVGPPDAIDTQLGSLISQAHREKVEGYIALAREEGGTVLTGGARPTLPPPYDQGAFLLPTVIEGLDPGCRTVQEEIFGPVVTVHPFRDEAEALALANGVQYGLSASVWTGDLSRAHRVSAELETGMVWVNTWLLRDLRVPFGGIKNSGVGREGGRHSLEFFSEARNVCIQL
ncbi:MAG: aldehyde dehydrogenase [Planctomycetes bacterium]|nr:aldehyde dehydrogenase [Planctomycetota bacterium]